MKLKGWKDLPIATTVPASTAEQVETGQWRSIRPVWDEEKCIHCLQCWVQCPDRSIKADEKGNMTGIEYFYCKGCGLCAAICPKKAIEMRPEAEFLEE
ncbi:MAG TPA: pyruvate ferredoxin oxidoreductase [Synergistaceae bacterium]|jgi:pyruvate ferredoxin oxidoreductase delta subunit|nr:MAG: Pyruvate ferredoxin/flavodoxin oxidoreductase, delta subunit [Synergistales bacterium 53_16]KUL05365.1 MAG: Pyruvate ferredoxin/flavodoxin oxidoreductase, delta subunit [Synergistales bacterium 54_9]MDK2845904.1 pyruvate ferredoxin oxidoreductase delta subunit [Synergistales bacterium]HAA47728.1 pyruvate ferredoxin oxidoreductase [Synergistaceae bacterium]MDN5335578.1 pyruvate ferredoxin oxidoreductase delta subunit [Synergistales bacterium]